LPLISEIKVDKNKFFSNFYDINNIANIKMLKCIHLLFDKSNIFNNSANYLLIILIFIGILSAIIFCCYNNLKIKKDIKQIYFETKFNENKSQATNINDKRDKNKNKKQTKKLTKTNTNKIKPYNNDPPKKKINAKKRQTFIDKNKNSIKNILETNNIDNNDDKSPNNNNIDKRNTLFLNINVKSKHRNKKSLKNLDKESSVNALKRKTKKFQNLKLNDKFEIENIGVYTDSELNSMDYEEAIKYDQRNFVQYYLSLIKNQNLLIFTFIQCKDYNSQMIKFDLFLFSFSINYVMSAMFYSDGTMHKIYAWPAFINFLLFKNKHNKHPK
jgi:hypothetical protein